MTPSSSSRSSSSSPPAAQGRTHPLSGVRVLDLSRVLAGPWAAQMLADLGAEVIKIERPGSGDDARTYGPPYMQDAAGCATDDNAFFLSANRGKKSVEADLSSAQGQAVVRALASKSDVVIENFRVGALARYGLDYDSLKTDNPDLIYCSITGFGQNGPYSHRPGYDAIFQGMSGLMSVTGPKEGAPGAGPVKVGPSIVDILCGLFASNAILAALHHRAMGGRGQHIDVSLLDSAVAAMSHYAQIYLLCGDVPIRRGTEGNGGFPSQMLPCADGQIMLTAGNDRQFGMLCTVLGLPQLAADERYRTNNQRVANRATLTAILEEKFRTRTVTQWLADLDAAGIPAGPINDMAQVFGDPQVRHRGMAIQVAHATGRTIDLVGNPIFYSDTPLGPFAAPPVRGQHTEEVLQSTLGYTREQAQGYRAALRPADPGGRG